MDQRESGQESNDLSCPNPRCQRGWMNCGYQGPDPDDYVCLDVLIVDWQRCRICHGTGVYVSRARAGLSAPSLPPDASGVTLPCVQAAGVASSG